MLNTIVVPLDGTDFSARAIPAAVAVGRAGKARLRLVGVARTDLDREPLRRHVEEEARRLAADGSPEVEVIVNEDPAVALLEIADEPDTVLCFASHDHLPVSTAVMHSVGSILIERAPHPFIVVGTDPGGGVPLTSNDVVVAVDGVEDPGPLLSTAAAWARHLQAPLRVVTVYEPVPPDIRQPAHYTRHHGPPGDPDRYLIEIGRRLEETGLVPIDLTAVPDPTSVADGLTRHLRDSPALLLVVGSRRPGAHVAPGMLRHLLRELPLPVLVVKGRDWPAGGGEGELSGRSVSPPSSKGTAMADTTMARPATEIRPFRVDVPEEQIVDLRRRLAATRWPDEETVDDRSQGVRLAKIQALVRYWEKEYDWRKVEARLNALPQFVTGIDGLDIHFIHVRSQHEDALPLIMTHGWPGSVLELLKTIEPLTDPTAHGGTAEDAFHLVMPSMPGYGFSERPASVGWGPDRMSRAWHELMLRLGYDRYVSQGGDWGSVVADRMARQAPEGLLGIHVNMPATVPPEIAKALTAGATAPVELSPREKEAFDQMRDLYTNGSGYAGMMVTRPQTIGYSLADSPVGLAAWFYDKFADWTYSGGVPERSLSYDEMLDDISLYWFTNTGASGARLYWENNANNFNAVDISLPAAITVFPGEIYRAPRSWAERAYHNLIYFNEVDKGGHFAAWEEPELLASELRAAFRSLR